MNILASLSPLDLTMIIAIPSALLIGAGIFFLAGVHHPKKDYAIIIERAGEYYCTYTSGTHFKMPLAYQRVGNYCTAPIIRGYITKANNHIMITYQIEDVKTFHYSRTKFEDIMEKIEKENKEVNLQVLTDNFTKYGLKLISIKKADY